MLYTVGWIIAVAVGAVVFWRFLDWFVLGLKPWESGRRLFGRK